jgi:hypothetical protein
MGESSCAVGCEGEWHSTESGSQPSHAESWLSAVALSVTSMPLCLRIRCALQKQYASTHSGGTVR